MTVAAAGELYRWLSAAFDVPDGALLTREFATLGLRCAHALVPNVPLPACVALQKEGDDADAAEVRLLRLQREYARLFIGPPRALIRPYESCGMGEDRLIGERTLAVQQFYAAAGLVPDTSAYGEAPDHLVIELSALAMICSGQTGHSLEARTRLEREFLTAHLGQWGRFFAGQVCEQSREPLYCAAAELLDWVLVTRPAP